MEYPHIKYIKYLLSKKYTPEEIQEDCLRLNLLVPLEDDVFKISASMGTPPSTWVPIYEKKNGYFNKWLRKKGIIDIWINRPEVQSAVNFLYKRSMRRDFETLVLAHGDLIKVREQLLLKYPENTVPDQISLEKYYDIFWDVGSLSKDGLFEFINRNEGKEAKLAALDGDMVETYARIGINQQISSKQFLDNIISLANHQVRLARMSGEVLSGNAMMGIAALSRQGLEAVKQREELESTGSLDVLDSIKEQANAFHIKKIEDSNIITIEELEEFDGRPKLTVIGDDF